MSIDLLSDLNAPQQDAVTHRDGPLLVLAGPGSGKTRVITRRAANLVAHGTPPWKVLAITFTNKAADEMRRRISELGVEQGMWVYTFHALGVRLLRQFGTLARIQPGFSIYDEADQKRSVKEAMALCSVGDHLIKPDQILSEISKAKNRLETPAQYAERSEFFDQRMIARIYDAYEQVLEQRNAVDFDDLLMRVAIVLRDHEEMRAQLSERFSHVLIDEYQDTNHAQYLIAKLLASAHRNICVTGDPDQSIYAWRGADISNILDFERDYPEVKTVRLEENYRSTPSICRVASQLIRSNRRRKHKELFTNNPDRAPVELWEFAEGRDEAEQVAQKIETLHNAGRPYADIALMYRVNAVSRGLEEALRFRGIPYRIARGVEFYNRKEVRDTLSYLRVVVNPLDQAALLRIVNTPTRGIGATTLKRLTAHAQATGKPLLDVMRTPEEVPDIKTAAAKVKKFVALLDELTRQSESSVVDAMNAALDLTGLEAMYRAESDESGEDRQANLLELVSAAQRYDDEVPEPTLEDFLQRVSLTSDQDAIDGEEDAVLLLTLHAAKGLEFPVVFVVGLEQGLLPHERALGGDGDIEEERRLAFVGITRAQEQLTLTHARQRLLRGMLMPRAASQFLSELPDDALDYRSFGGVGRIRGHAALDPDAFDPDAFDPDAFIPVDPPPGTPPVSKRPSLSPDAFDQRHRQRVNKLRISNRNPDEQFIDVRADLADAKSESSEIEPWQAGMIVRHAKYGVGQLQWTQPGPVAGQTRGSIRFASYGEKIFILEMSPLERVSR